MTLLDNVLQAQGPNDENNAIVSLHYVITDADGSTAPGTLTITFNDDAPTNNNIAPVAVGVQEDALANFDPADANADHIFGSTGNNEGGKTVTAQITAASLAPTVSVGADEPATFSLNLAASGSPGSIVGTAVMTAGNVAVTSKGAAVEYGILNGAIVGYVDVNNDNLVDGTDRLVFRLAPNGADFTFSLMDQVDHLPITPGERRQPRTRAIDLVEAFLVTDFDGDRVALDNGAVG